MVFLLQLPSLTQAKCFSKYWSILTNNFYSFGPIDLVASLPRQPVSHENYTAQHSNVAFIRGAFLVNVRLLGVRWTLMGKAGLWPVVSIVKLSQPCIHDRPIINSFTIPASPFVCQLNSCDSFMFGANKIMLRQRD
jgi:hypothetical protein